MNKKSGNQVKSHEISPTVRRFERKVVNISRKMVNRVSGSSINRLLK